MTSIVVFEQNGSGEKKIHGIREYGHDIEIVRVCDIKASLPEFVENPEEYISDDFMADLVLDFLVHPDLSHYLTAVCLKKDIPVIASGKKNKGAIIPFTCCGLGRSKRLGAYGEQFGLPEFRATVREGRLEQLEVVRGAPCGVTWQIISRVQGLSVEEAIPTIAREAQYLCIADPSAFDPISGKSPLHYAGEVHAAALKRAVKKQQD